MPKENIQYLSDFGKNNFSDRSNTRQDFDHPRESLDNRQFVSLSQRNSFKSSPMKGSGSKEKVNSVERKMLRESSLEVAKMRSII